MATTLIDPTDLRANALATAYLKNESVDVIFAHTNGCLQSREGENGYACGDALITGSTGDRWSVTRARFDAKYTPIAPTKPGEAGRYANIPIPVLALQILHDFSIARQAGGDIIHGKAGDWLMQYAPGDFGIVAAVKFIKVYRRVG